jgi:gliding motility-associated lipoprotein GldH
LKINQRLSPIGNITRNTAGKMKKTCLIMLVALLYLSCDDRQKVFEEFRTIQGQAWNSKDVLHFNVDIMDSTESCNVYIAVRNTSDYEYSNLYLFVTAHSPNGSEVRDTVEITLADIRGKWLGKGAASVFTLYYPYRQNIRFPLRGIYTFDIEQAMWITNLKHLSHIGLRIEKSKELH